MLNCTSGLTITAWTKADTWEGRNARILQKGKQDNQYRLTKEGGSMLFDLSNVGMLYASVPPPGRWVHVAATYDGSQMCIYYDGKQAASKSASGAIATTPDPLCIGTKNINVAERGHFKGLLDDIHIYNYGLSEAEVMTLYEGM